MKYFLPIILVSLFMMNGSQSNGQSLQKQLHKIMEDIYPSGTPGAALLVMKSNEIIIEEGFGLADLKTTSRVTAQTNFRMASVSKQFTAMCILLLAHQNKLSLNDPVSKYLAEWPSFAGEVTIKNLLTHSSGLADYESLMRENRTGQITDAEVLDLVRKSDSLYFAAGSKFRYSNTGFCILTQIVENISGKDYQDFIHSNIFQPLKMDHSMMYGKNVHIPNRAYGYHNENGTWKFADQSATSATLGDGSVYTSLHDYQKWIKGLWDQKLFSFNEDLNPLLPRISIKTGLNYGYGWFTSIEPDGTSADFHSGESTGFHNIVYQNPEKKDLIIIFSNSDDERISDAFEKICTLMNIKPIANNERPLFDYLSNIYE